MLSLLQGDEDDDEDDEDDDDDEGEDSNIMFDGLCKLFERIPVEGQEESEKVETPLGIVDLKILYDDDVYGARIVAVEHDFVSLIRDGSSLF